MKNKNGFTLVELLGVIAILAIIITISVVSVSGIINKSTDDAYKTIENEMVEAAKKYVIKNIKTINDDNTIKLNDLINDGYLKEVKDPNDNGEECNKTNSNVKVRIDNNKYTYTPHLECGDYVTNQE